MKQKDYLYEVQQWMGKLNPDVAAIRREREREKLDEASISQKKRDQNDMIRQFQGRKTHGFNNIKSIVVVTGNNPDTQESSNAQNKKYNRDLKQSLKGRYSFVPVRGQFAGSSEQCYAIINMSREEGMYYAGMCQQTSFIYTEFNNGNVHSEYWEKQDNTLPYNKRNNPYVKKDECDEYIDKNDPNVEDNKDNYTIIGNRFKYNIPFSIFEEVSRKIDANLTQILERDGLETTEEKKQALLEFVLHRKGMTPQLYRKKIMKLD